MGKSIWKMAKMIVPDRSVLLLVAIGSWEFSNCFLSIKTMFWLSWQCFHRFWHCFLLLRHFGLLIFWQFGNSNAGLSVLILFLATPAVQVFFRPWKYTIFINNEKQKSLKTTSIRKNKFYWQLNLQNYICIYTQVWVP